MKILKDLLKDSPKQNFDYPLIITVVGVNGVGKTTSIGKIANKLVKEGFYSGIIFHRVIPGFMIQGGGYEFVEGSYNHKEADSIKGEFASNGVKNDLKHTRGVLSMARTMIPNSASSQFFIMHQDAPHLDGQYAAFGKVTSGMEVVDKIANTPRNRFNDKPLKEQKMKLA